MLGADAELSEETCPHCGVVWLRGWCQDCNHENALPGPPQESPPLRSLCPVCALLEAPTEARQPSSDVSVVCGRCRRHFFWPPQEQREYLQSQQPRWVPRYCAACLRQLQGKQQEDLRGLAEAAQRLAQACRRLTPNLRDPEKVTLRYWRAQQRALWILSTYGRYFPPDLVYHVQSHLGQPYLASPFDETVPPRGAVQRLRQVARELLAAVEAALREQTPPEEGW